MYSLSTVYCTCKQVSLYSKINLPLEETDVLAFFMSWLVWAIGLMNCLSSKVVTQNLNPLHAYPSLKLVDQFVTGTRYFPPNSLARHLQLEFQMKWHLQLNLEQHWSSGALEPGSHQSSRRPHSASAHWEEETPPPSAAPLCINAKQRVAAH